MEAREAEAILYFHLWSLERLDDFGEGAINQVVKPPLSASSHSRFSTPSPSNGFEARPRGRWGSVDSRALHMTYRMDPKLLEFRLNGYVMFERLLSAGKVDDLRTGRGRL